MCDKRHINIEEAVLPWPPSAASQRTGWSLTPYRGMRTTSFLTRQWEKPSRSCLYTYINTIRNAYGLVYVSLLCGCVHNLYTWFPNASSRTSVGAKCTGTLSKVLLSVLSLLQQYTKPKAWIYEWLTDKICRIYSKVCVAEQTVLGVVFWNTLFFHQDYLQRPQRWLLGYSRAFSFQVMMRNH